ncbi:hypothetical protein ASD66_13415 [Nocardioides sp. Root151]|nr:hypothetical protein ASD66_13415 [Nocardioides sp. Root151]
MPPCNQLKVWWWASHHLAGTRHPSLRQVLSRESFCAALVEYLGLPAQDGGDHLRGAREAADLGGGDLATVGQDPDPDAGEQVGQVHGDHQGGAVAGMHREGVGVQALEEGLEGQPTALVEGNLLTGRGIGQRGRTPTRGGLVPG